MATRLFESPGHGSPAVIIFRITEAVARSCAIRFSASAICASASIKAASHPEPFSTTSLNISVDKIIETSYAADVGKNDMETAYQRALEGASKELESLDEMVYDLECQRAKLRQAIAILQTLLGQPISQNQTLTDAIIDFVRAKDGYAATTDVMDGLISRGYSAPPRSVATILSKLVRERQLRKGPKGGYKWAGIPNSAEEISLGPARSKLHLTAKPGAYSPPSRPPSRPVKTKS
jgi:hypothetical protein